MAGQTPHDPNAHHGGRQGFASMDAARQRAIASKGGRSVPPQKRPFARNAELAAAAGRKGGKASHGPRSRGA